MPSQPRVCVVILNWNQPALTALCLKHVLAQAGVTVTTVIVDNGSTPDNRARLETECASHAELIWLPTNAGFTGGMNAGIQYAFVHDYEFVWLLNNDAFPEEECLVRMISDMSYSANIAAATPLIYDREGREQPIGSEVDWRHGGNNFHFSSDRTCFAHRGGWIVGTALLLRTSNLLAVGSLDESFFAYWEEVDLCTRLIDSGAKLRVVTHARCMHLGRASTVGADESSQPPLVAHLVIRNGLYFLRKHLTGVRGAVAILRFAVRSIVMAERVSRTDQKEASARIGGVWHFFTRKCGKPLELTSPHWFEYSALWISRRFAPALLFINRSVLRL